MPAQNSFKGKFHEGLFANGEGPIKGFELKVEGETKGQLEPVAGMEGRHLNTHGGQGDGLMGRAEDKAFDLYGKSYMPSAYGSLRPRNHGDTPNYKVNEK